MDFIGPALIAASAALLAVYGSRTVLLDARMGRLVWAALGVLATLSGVIFLALASKVTLEFVRAGGL